MDEKYNVWKTLLKQEKPIQPILDYINEQAELLKEATAGKVLAKFSENNTGVELLLSGLGKAMAESYQLFWSKKDVADAATLYTKVYYEFIIYDAKHTYELSVFRLGFNDTLPADLYIDPTIAEEAGLQDKHEIEEQENFDRLFVEMIKTHKVQYVINRLMQLNDEQS